MDNSVSPGIGHRLDGWPNRDLNVGAIVDLAPDLSAIQTLLGVDRKTVDTVLPNPRNVESVRDALAAANNKDVTLRMLPKASHNLFEAASPNAAELPRAQRYVAGLFPTIARWLEKRVRQH